MRKFILAVFAVVMIATSAVTAVNAKAVPQPQMCEVWFNYNIHYIECSGIGDGDNYYRTVRGDMKDIYCYIGGYPLARHCQYIPMS